MYNNRYNCVNIVIEVYTLVATLQASSNHISPLKKDDAL